jgi:hypothetical protein
MLPLSLAMLPLSLAMLPLPLAMPLATLPLRLALALSMVLCRSTAADHASENYMMYLARQAFTPFKRVLTVSFARFETKSQIGRQASIKLWHQLKNNSD